MVYFAIACKKHEHVYFYCTMKANLKIMKVQDFGKGWASSNAVLTCAFFIRNCHLNLLHSREINTPQADTNKLEVTMITLVEVTDCFSGLRFVVMASGG
jgi:hypothetical protein